MSGEGGWDEMLNEAREGLAEQEDDPNADLGDEMTPEPGEHFMGRWRGDGKMQTKRGLVDVYLVWDRDDDRRGFLFQHSRLAAEVEEQRPEVGDQVLVLRGETEPYERDGEEREIFPFVLRKRECSDPLPGEAAEQGEQPQDDDDLPFLCQAERESRSAPAVGAVTG